jgi:hypothetical protein
MKCFLVCYFCTFLVFVVCISHKLCKRLLCYLENLPKQNSLFVFMCYFCVVMDDQWILDCFFTLLEILEVILKINLCWFSIIAYIANSFSNTQSILIVIVFHNNQLSTVTNFLNNDFCHLVKPKSIRWFFQFLMIEYYNDKCIKNYKMNKELFFKKFGKMRVKIIKHDTKYGPY